MITMMQISQMVVGIACFLYYYVTIFHLHKECSMLKETMMACGVMYSTYLYLFADFFVKRFIYQNKEAKKLE